MGVVAKLASFAVALVATFALAFGVGRAVGPVGDDAKAPTPVATTSTTMDGNMDMGGH